MAHINLLPWREEKRKEQQKQFASITGLSVVLIALIILAVHFQYSRMIDYQNSRNAFLKREISKVEKQIKEIEDLNKEKQRLLARMEVIQELQHNRPEIVHLFDELVRIMPDGTYFNSFKQNNRALSIEGLAQSNARVSALMRNLENSDWFANPVLKIIQSDKADVEASRKFSLKVTQTSKKANADKK
ncbi:MAG: PilN domain-containing protein [Gammaproteobacteria bacterium]